MIGVEIDLAEQTVAASPWAHTIVHSRLTQTPNLGCAAAAGAIPRVAYRIVVERIDNGARDQIVCSEVCDRADMLYAGSVPPVEGMRRIDHRLSDFRVGDVSARFRGEKRFLPAADLAGGDIVAHRRWSAAPAGPCSRQSS